MTSKKKVKTAKLPKKVANKFFGSTPKMGSNNVQNPGKTKK